MTKTILWYDEGKNVNGLQTLDEVIEAADLNFPMELCPVNTTLPDGTEKAEENQYNVVRTDTNETLTRKTVTESYGLLQNRDLIFVAQDLMSQGCTADAAGIIDNGRRVFCVLNFPEMEQDLRNPEIMDDQPDLMMPRIGIFGSNDGSASVVVKLMSLRMRCCNLYQAGVKDKGRTIKIKHTKNIGERLYAAAAMLKGLRDEWFARIRFYRAMQEKYLDFASAQIAARRILQIDDEKAYDELPTKSQNRVVALLDQFNNEERGTYGRTAYDMFNATTAYNTHEINTKRSRMDYVANGDGAKRENRAMQVLAEMAEYDLAAVN